MPDEVCDYAKESARVGAYFVDGCLFIFSTNENNLAFSINSLREFDIVNTRRVFQCM